MAQKGSKTKKPKSKEERAKQRWRTSLNKTRRIKQSLTLCKSASHKKNLEDRMRFWQTMKVI